MVYKYYPFLIVDFLGGPMVKTLSSNAEGVGSILGRGTKIPHAHQKNFFLIKK